MGQWGRQHEQVNCCFLETVSVHPTWSTQSSGRSSHHSSERRISIHNTINTGVGAPMEAPPTDATTVGLAVNVLAGPTALAWKRRGVVRFVCRGPHRGRATHPPPVCLKKCCLHGLLQLRSARFTKSALCRPSPPSPLPPLRLPPGAPLPFLHRSSAPQRSLPWMPPAPAVDPLARSTPPPAPF